MNQDWRSFFKEYEEQGGEVLRIKEELNREYEPTGIMMELEKQKRYPVVHFEKIAGSEFSVMANTIGTRERLALSLDVEEKELYRALAEKIQKSIEPEVIEEAPFKENCLQGEELDLTNLPLK